MKKIENISFAGMELKQMRSDIEAMQDRILLLENRSQSSRWAFLILGFVVTSIILSGCDGDSGKTPDSECLESVCLTDDTHEFCDDYTAYTTFLVWDERYGVYTSCTLTLEDFSSTTSDVFVECAWTERDIDKLKRAGSPECTDYLCTDPDRS